MMPRKSCCKIAWIRTASMWRPAFISRGVYYIGETLENVMQAIRSACPEGLELRTFVGMPHYGYSDELKPLVHEAIESELVDGVDLHAEEYAPMEPWTAKIWEAARGRMGNLPRRMPESSCLRPLWIGSLTT